MIQQNSNGNAPNNQTTSPKSVIVTANVEELMGNIPSWILRWGITLVFFIVLAFIWLAWFIQYPDVVKAGITLTTQKPPIPVMALSNGKISQLFVANNEVVDSGKVLAILENTARWEDVLILEKWLSDSLVNDPLSIEPPAGLQVGILQNSYARLTQLNADFQYVTTETGSTNKVGNLQRQIRKLDNLKTNYSRQKRDLDVQLKTVQNEYNRYKSLQKQFTSATEREKYEAAIAEANQKIQSMDAQIISTAVQQEQLQGQILEVGTVKNTTETDKSLNLKNSLQSLGSEIKKWKQDYLLVAPIAGQVSLSKIWSPQQTVTTDQEVLTIVPSRRDKKSNQIVCKALLPMASSGKVKPKQTVFIELENYPVEQFGELAASVINVAPAPTKEGYPIEIALDNKMFSITDTLLTTTLKPIVFLQGLNGKARIITENRRILSRIFDKFRAVLKFT